MKKAYIATGKTNEVLTIIPQNGFDVEGIVQSYSYLLSQYISSEDDSFIDFAKNQRNNPFVCAIFKENANFEIKDGEIIYRYSKDEEPEEMEIVAIMNFVNNEKSEITAYVNGSNFFIVDSNGNKFYYYAD